MHTSLGSRLNVIGIILKFQWHSLSTQVGVSIKLSLYIGGVHSDTKSSKNLELEMLSINVRCGVSIGNKLDISNSLIHR